MPFTDNVTFKQSPKLIHRANGVYYYLENNTRILDGMSGLWCVNAGHGQQKINDAIKSQLDKYRFLNTKMFTIHFV